MSLEGPMRYRRMLKIDRHWTDSVQNQTFYVQQDNNVRSGRILMIYDIRLIMSAVDGHIDRLFLLERLVQPGFMQSRKRIRNDLKRLVVCLSIW